MATSLSDSSFIIYKKEDTDERILCIKLTIDCIYKYEIFCSDQEVFGKVSIHDNVYILKHTDPINNIVLRDVISSSLILCRDGHAISSWHKNNKNGKNTLSLFGIQELIILVFVIAIISLSFLKFGLLFLLIPSIFLLISNVTRKLEFQKELDRFTEETKNYNKENNKFVEAIPDIDTMLRRSIVMLDEQIEKKRNNKKALN